MYDRYVKLRDANNVKDSDVAKNTGIGRSTFSDWKSGRSQPKKEKLEKIAEYFGVPIEYFYSGETPKYYLNDDTARIAQEIFENPTMRILFDASRNVSPDNLEFLAQMAKKLEETNPDG